ncbi:MAG: DUF2232 domain-containing protein [Spirochaetes bacterium]|nr:DUF2232 domain-containing protein [Spirochaetota bacterium]
MAPVAIVLFGGLVLTLGAALIVYRWGWPAAGAMALLASVSLFVPEFDIGKAGLFAPILVGFAAGHTIRTGKTITWYLVAASLLLSLLFSGQFYYQTGIQGADVLGQLKAQFEQTIRGSDAPEDLRDAMIVQFNGWVDGTGREIIPFLFFMNGLVFAALAFPFLGLLFRRMSGAQVRGLEFFRLHDYAIFALIVGWGAVLLFGGGPLRSAGLNIALAASVLYLVQALGVVKFLLVKRGLPAFLLPLILAITLIAGFAVLGFVLVLLAGLGALDFWADFRKLEKQTT